MSHRVQDFAVTILTAINEKPYFEEPLSEDFPMELIKTHDPLEWRFKLPPVKDFEGSVVTVTVDFGSNSWISYDSTAHELVIEDLSDDAVGTGEQTFVITLDDGEPANLVTETIILNMIGAPPLPEEPEEEPEPAPVVETPQPTVSQPVAQQPVE